MAQPNYNNYFGAGAIYTTAETPAVATDNNPHLIIKFSDFADEGLTDPLSFQDPDKLLTAIIRKAQKWLATDNTEDPGTDITTPIKAFTTRNNEARISWLYYISFFTPDTSAAHPDPDEVV